MVLGIAYSVGFTIGTQGIAVPVPGVLMTRVCYGHFMVEHYLGHHPPAQRGFFSNLVAEIHMVYASL